ncbi:MAG: CapA family protein, partial [Acetatifactor sp.]|nr:CapA family protein [Acetatifactor sp.]
MQNRKRGNSAVKKIIIWLGIDVVLVLLLAACGEGAADNGVLPLTSAAIGRQDNEVQETSGTRESGEAIELVSIPIPTEAPRESSEEIMPQPETVAAEPTEPPPDILTITISAAGDCSLGNHQDQEYAYSFRQAYDQIEDEGYFFENVRDIFASDDMTIVNFEGVLTFSEERDETRTYNIKGDPDYARLLTAGSVETVSFANNHRLDYGTGGSDDTVAALEAADIIYAYDRNVGIYETEKGIRIGFVSVNEVSWGLGSEPLLADGIVNLQEQGVDLILACCHWGIERDNYPTE